MAESAKHKSLKDTAICWLYERGCHVFAQECYGGYAVGNGDAIGMKKNGTVYYIEAKASRDDLFSRKQKAVGQKVAEGRTAPKILQWMDTGNGIDFHYFIIADDVRIGDAYADWGVIDERGKVIRRAKKFKTTESAKKEITMWLAHTCSMRAYNYLLFPKISPLQSEQKPYSTQLVQGKNQEGNFATAN